MTQVAVSSRRRQGFPGERMRVLPQTMVAQALDAPVTSQLLVTDAGFFPRASSHGRTRKYGAQQNIVIVCVAGQGWCRLPLGGHAVAAGQALIIPSGVPHQYDADPTDPWTIWWMHLVGRAVPELIRTTGATVAKPVFRLADPAPIVSLIDTVVMQMDKDETMSSVIAASGAAWHAMALLAVHRRAIGRTTSDPIDVTIRHLKDNLTSRVSLTELAAMVGLSVSHFSTLFRKSTGYGALAYQKRLRMASARELLDTTDRTVASIAAEVGYPDPLYFSRQFRRIHLQSPSEYRQLDKG